MLPYELDHPSVHQNQEPYELVEACDLEEAYGHQEDSSLEVPCDLVACGLVVACDLEVGNGLQVACDLEEAYGHLEDSSLVEPFSLEDSIPEEVSTEDTLKEGSLLVEEILLAVEDILVEDILEEAILGEDILGEVVLGEDILGEVVPEEGILEVVDLASLILIL